LVVLDSRYASLFVFSVGTLVGDAAAAFPTPLAVFFAPAVDTAPPWLPAVASFRPPCDQNNHAPAAASKQATTTILILRFITVILSKFFGHIIATTLISKHRLGTARYGFARPIRIPAPVAERSFIVPLARSIFHSSNDSSDRTRPLPIFHPLPSTFCFRLS
jgi:hypothetical protein